MLHYTLWYDGRSVAIPREVAGLRAGAVNKVKLFVCCVHWSLAATSAAAVVVVIVVIEIDVEVIMAAAAAAVLEMHEASAGLTATAAG